MTSEINIIEIKDKLIERLTPTGWATKLRGFIQSSDFNKILEALVNEREDGKRFTPPLKYVFRAFETCPLQDLKVIIIGQDPYPALGVADGIAFSCSLTDKVQPSLQHIFSEIQRTVYQEEIQEQDPDLTRWSEQGVLMLNTALTTRIGQPDTHQSIWKDFMAYVLDILSLTSSGLIFVLLGSKAQELESIIGPNHYILKASHPASAIYTGGQWDCKDVFNQVNKILERNNGPEFQINW